MIAALDQAPELDVRTRALPSDIDPLERLPAAAPLAWVREGEGIAAWGEAARITLPPEADAAGTDRFTRAAAALEGVWTRTRVSDEVGLPGTGALAFGSFTFDPRSGGSVLVVPRVVCGRRAGKSWVTTVADRGAEHPADPLDAPVPPAAPVGPLTWRQGALAAEEWERTVAEAVARIRGGALEKAVMARDVVAEAARPIDVRTLLRRLARDYPDCYTFSVAGMVGATPELLLRREGDEVHSVVLAGTRPRGATPEEDARLAHELAASAKDAEEHRLAIESLRRTLAPLSAGVDAPDGPELVRLPNVQHLASPAAARLLPGVSTLRVVAALHPTAAVGGTPTPAAVELIAELEGMDRGRYAGPVGWVDSEGNGEWGIALRCAHVEGARARLFAGCGIVAGSEPAAELAEAEAKLRVMRAALTDPPG
ncbi:isochorismate synthase MenF [Streptomonospora nanhaiensis]|uniref:isochorismate synthase n=1 Tax=Streptomonospora nanhaiensis TaxID=1323731 RepID=A0A853BHB5_9ACTN|nr:isochorismate synthase [Streptomonospora nanhaiensis]MBX9390490.1 isochorismate synthase [Streptomonospora nanhaiensis]NYI94002.1 menaquinone-specific isochorismate synthase [Streptomonospora nanhaiensis]